MQRWWSKWGSAAQCQNPLGHQANAGRQTEQEKTQPRRTAREVREESAHDTRAYKVLNFNSKPEGSGLNTLWSDGSKLR